MVPMALPVSAALIYFKRSHRRIGLRPCRTVDIRRQRRHDVGITCAYIATVLTAATAASATAATTTTSGNTDHHHRR